MKFLHFYFYKIYCIKITVKLDYLIKAFLCENKEMEEIDKN